MKETANIFPGQGTQFVGMGKDLKKKSIFDDASQILGLDLARICFEGPEDELRKTENAQPAIFTVSVAKFLEQEERPSVVAGHSLGEYTALCAAGIVTFEDGLGLVKLRGKWMSEADPEGIGTMMAVIGQVQERMGEIRRICAKNNIVIANYNSPEQVVISGKKKKINRASKEITEIGFRVAELNVSSAYHSPLMASAGEKLSRAIMAINILKPRIPIIFNVSAEYADTPEMIRANLINQLTQPVQWQKTIEKIVQKGVQEDNFIELGPKQILMPFVNKIFSRFPGRFSRHRGE